MADWFVYQHDGKHLGPLSTEAVADAILTGKLRPDVWVGAPGGSRWLRALDVPVIAERIDSVPTARPDSGVVRSIVLSSRAIDSGSAGGTVPMAPPLAPPRGAETERSLLPEPSGVPSSQTALHPQRPIYRGAETLESAPDPPRRRSQSGS